MIDIDNNTLSKCISFLREESVVNKNQGIEMCLNFLESISDSISDCEKQSSYDYSAYLRRTETGVYTVIFRHPLILVGKRGARKKVHLSLQTKIESEAMTRLNALNSLLHNKSYWEVDKLNIARKDFGNIPANVFFKPWLSSIAEK